MVIFHALVVICILFSKLTFSKNISGTLECQKVWIQIKTDVPSVLIWVQTICKDLSADGSFEYTQYVLVEK